MKRVYEKPCVDFEQYSLNTQIAGACKDAGKDTAVGHDPITLEGKRVHCVVYPSGDTKNCSDGAHTWTIQLDGTIFADGAATGCTHDVYSLSDYTDLLAESWTGGSTISGGDCGDYFSFKGSSKQHTGSIEQIEYFNFFRS